MSQKVNCWTKWHSKTPIFDPKTEDDLNWAFELQEKAKDFHDRNTLVGDIVHQRERNIQILLIKFRCQECGSLVDTRRGLSIHIMKEHNYGRKDALILAKMANEAQVPRTLADVDLYYEVVQPRKILNKPLNVEVNLNAPIKKGTLAPTPIERERHDAEVIQWRAKQHGEKDKTKEELKFPEDPRWRYERNLRKGIVQVKGEETLERLPNGLFIDAGLGENWWHYTPNVWRQEAKDGKGAWLEPTDQECQNWKALNLPKRVLVLLTIVEDV